MLSTYFGRLFFFSLAIAASGTQERKHFDLELFCFKAIAPKADLNDGNPCNDDEDLKNDPVPRSDLNKSSGELSVDLREECILSSEITSIALTTGLAGEIRRSLLQEVLNPYGWQLSFEPEGPERRGARLCLQILQLGSIPGQAP